MAAPDPSWICPITQCVMTDPVFTADGNTYERAAIERWFAEGHRTAPLTGAALPSTCLLYTSDAADD